MRISLVMSGYECAACVMRRFERLYAEHSRRILAFEGEKMKINWAEYTDPRKGDLSFPRTMLLMMLGVITGERKENWELFLPERNISFPNYFTEKANAVAYAMHIAPHLFFQLRRYDADGNIAETLEPEDAGLEFHREVVVKPHLRADSA